MPGDVQRQRHAQDDVDQRDHAGDDEGIGEAVPEPATNRDEVGVAVDHIGEDEEGGDEDEDDQEDVAEPSLSLGTKPRERIFSHLGQTLPLGSLTFMTTSFRTTRSIKARTMSRMLTNASGAVRSGLGHQERLPGPDEGRPGLEPLGVGHGGERDHRAAGLAQRLRAKHRMMPVTRPARNSGRVMVRAAVSLLAPRV